MFSGIIEETSELIHFKQRQNIYELCLSRPKSLNDLKKGDSVSVDGVCLTIENRTRRKITFAVGPETLRVTGWHRFSDEREKVFNLERSLPFGTRIHGHFVTGHVDGVGQIVNKVNGFEICRLTLHLPENLMPLVWSKGSLALNGVSLTVNAVRKNEVSLDLIPETLKRTNLGELQIGDKVCVEMDMVAKSIANYIENLNIKEYFRNILIRQMPKKPIGWLRDSFLNRGNL